MKISIAIVEKFNPCKNRFDNFKTNNPGFNGSLVDFLNLDNITYSDKIWVCTRLMTRNQKFRFALACTISVVDIYNNKYPNDKRVSDLIEFMKSIPDVDKMSEETRNRLTALRQETRNASDDAASDDVASDDVASAAYAAAYAAYAASDDAASVASAAYAAAYAAYAASAAYAAAYAAYAASDDAASAASAAAYAAAYAASDDAAASAARQAPREHQENLNLILLTEVMEME